MVFLNPNCPHVLLIYIKFSRRHVLLERRGERERERERERKRERETQRKKEFGVLGFNASATARVT